MTLRSHVSPPSRVQRLLVAAVALAAVVPFLALGTARPAGATTAVKVTGQGSTSAALAFQTWTLAAQREGIDVTYTATGTAAGLAAYRATEVDFAGSEAEFSELYADTPSGTPTGHVPRGFAYAPDVGSASALMYHVARTPTGTDPLTDLRLSPITVAKIFLGTIKNWDSPTISADNTGLKLPNEPINVVYRSGQSGLTALFYDFVKHEDPTQFDAWAHSCGYNPNYRVWQITDCTKGSVFARTTPWSSADQQAQYIAGTSGLWSIGYDEFDYARVYNDDMASIENASGNWVQPDPADVTAALQAAVLNPNTSENLDGVYTSTNPVSYPISFYSYIVYQCAPSSGIPTCKGTYADPTVTNTMAHFMLYVACTGQRTLSFIGYARLPADLSQQLADAVGYMTGEPPVQLTAANCASPEFAPTVTSFTPSSGSTGGSTTVVIAGTDFEGATSVEFGTTPASSFTVTSPTTIRARTPAHAAGSVAISVTNPDGTATSSSDFTFVPPPTISAFTPAGGSTAGGTKVTVSGTDLSTASSVSFGSTPAASFTVANGTTIVATTKSHAAGTVAISVTTPGGTVTSSSDFTFVSPPPAGYDLVGSDGGVFVFPTGNPGGFYGSLPGLGVHVDDIVGMVPTSNDQGYFLVGADGGVFSFGDAPFLGSLPGLHVTPAQPITGIVPTGTDGGYFLVGRDGGVYAFGDAPFLGSLPGEGVRTDDVVGIAATPSGNGYWLVASTGKVYAFGAAEQLGSATGTSSPVSAIAGTPTGGGYWIVTQNGSVDPFGNARSFGSLPALGVTPAHPVIGVVHTTDTGGYWLVGSDGGIFAFGDAGFVGSLPGLGVSVDDIVGAVPTGS